MSARTSLLLLTAGAILLFAVRAEPGFLDLHVTGLILILVGLIRPLVAGWSSLAPRVSGRPERVGLVADDVTIDAAPVEAEPRAEVPGTGTEPASVDRPGAHPAAGGPTARRHLGRSTTSTS